MNKFSKIYRLLVFVVVFSSCKKEPKMFESISDSGINFSNNLLNTEELNILTYLYYYNGAGVAVADFNNDGLDDLYFTANLTEDKLYLNKGNFNFEDVTEVA